MQFVLESLDVVGSCPIMMRGVIRNHDAGCHSQNQRPEKKTLSFRVCLPPAAAHHHRLYGRFGVAIVLFGLPLHRPSSMLRDLPNDAGGPKHTTDPTKDESILEKNHVAGSFIVPAACCVTYQDV